MPHPRKSLTVEFSAMNSVNGKAVLDVLPSPTMVSLTEFKIWTLTPLGVIELGLTAFTLNFRIELVYKGILAVILNFNFPSSIMQIKSFK